MCGLAGFLSPGGFAPGGDAQRILTDMQARVVHRGPDSGGQWCDAQNGVALAHRRLSIIDLSDNGLQPMTSPAGRYVVAFNGEIYNHRELRHDLVTRDPGLSFVGDSDTETLLAGFDIWGIQATLRRATGMFAFALWDRDERCLALGRDRFGEKPLYYGWQRSGGREVFLFASELKAFHAHPAFERRLNRDSVAGYFQRLAVPGVASIFEGIHKVPPATFLTLRPGARQPAVTEFWPLGHAIRHGAEARFDGSDEDIAAQTHDLLSRAVKRQMISDVPLGAFLSGGVDSSTVVALMQQHSPDAVKTFTIGFDEADFDESGHAEKVAALLGTDHTMLRVTPAQARAVIPRLAEIYDEPFADVSQIPTFLVSQLARESVTVCMTGDGADELFGGYTRYANALRAWQIRRRAPPAIWGAISPAARRLERLSGTGFVAPLGQAARVAGMFDRATIRDYFAASSDYARLYPLVSGGQCQKMPTCSTAATDLERLLAHDLRHYLPDDILVKVDRAAMATGLETRAPFLDHTLVEFAFSLPPEAKLRPQGSGHETKWPVRQVLYKHLPKSLIERPKTGFGVPIGNWLRGALRDWGESYIFDSALGRDDLLNAKAIRHLWARHQRGIADHSAQLWAVLMFCSWRDRWL